MNNTKPVNEKLIVNNSDNRVYASHPAYDAVWDLTRGGTLVYLHDNRSRTTLIDARNDGPCPDIIVAVSAALEDKEHDITLSGLGQADVKIFMTQDSRQARLEFSACNNEIRIEQTLTLNVDTAWIEVKIALCNISDHDLLVDRYPDWEALGKSAVAGDLFNYSVNPGGVDFILSGLRIGGDYANTGYVTPACGYPFFHNRGRFADMGDTAISLVAGHHGAVLPCIMAYSELAQSGVLLSVLHDRCLNYVRMYADQLSQTGTITAQVWWARWLAPGEHQEVATWHIVPFIGDYGDMLDEYRHWLVTEYGITPPADAASHLDELFVGCTHPVVLEGLGHCEKMKPYVDALAEVGCTAFWWGKPWLDSIDVDKRAWMSRCQPQTNDYKYAVTPKYGGESAVRDLTDYIHAKGMKDIAWVTGYGLTVFDQLYKKHPEAFVRLRRPVKRNATDDVPGHELMPNLDVNAGVVDEYVYTPFSGATIGGDTTNHHWRKFWLHNQEYWAANGVDGIFFDSFNPMPPNYALRPWPGQIGGEIINLQREARRLARKVNPDFFSFTEGGGYRMATVNDFTHTWHGSTPPPLPPYRTQPLSPEEEARFLRDEVLSMIPGARSWALVANVEGDSAHNTGTSVLPRVLFSMFSGRMPILSMFQAGAQQEMITNECEFWAYFKPRPADDPAPAEKKHWEQVKRHWQLRMAYPELKSGSLIMKGVDSGDPAVLAFLREKDGEISAVMLNFRPDAAMCKLSVNWALAGVNLPDGELSPHELLHGVNLPATTASCLMTGYTIEIPARDGVVIKLK